MSTRRPVAFLHPEDLVSSWEDSAWFSESWGMGTAHYPTAAHARAHAKTKFTVYCEREQEATFLNALVGFGKSHDVPKLLMACRRLYQNVRICDTAATPPVSDALGAILHPSEATVIDTTPPSVVERTAPVNLPPGNYLHAVTVTVDNEVTYWGILELQRGEAKLLAAFCGDFWRNEPRRRRDTRKAEPLGHTNASVELFLILLRASRRAHARHVDEDPLPSVPHPKWRGRTVTRKDNVADPPHLSPHRMQDDTAHAAPRIHDRRPGGRRWNLTQIGRPN